MFDFKKRNNFINRDMDLTSIVKAMAAGAIVYHAARYMFHEMMDD